MGPVALAARWTGILLWGAARPGSLPVPAPEAAVSAPRSVPAAGGGLPRILAGMFLVLALAVFAVGFTAWHAVRSVVDEFAHTAPGTPLSVTAGRLTGGVEGAWWTTFYPTLSGRLDRAAARIRAGEEHLDRLASAYTAVRGRVNQRGLPGRILEGSAFLAPVDSALAAVRTPWHRGTLVYSEIQQAVGPYRDAAAPPAKLEATLFQAPPDHALVVAVTGPGGESLAASPPLALGQPASIPLVAGSRVELTALVRPSSGEAYRVESRTSFAVEDWPAGELTVPGSGAFQLRFDPEAARTAPVLPPLSEAARSEIDPGGGRTRR